MRKCRLALFGAVLMVFMPSFSALAQAAPDQSESCRRFVQDFYSWYVAAWARRDKHGPNSPTPYETIMKERSYLRAPSLLAALKQDDAAAEKNPGEIVGLDFDPYVNAQDFGESYRVGKVSVTGSTCKAAVYSYWDRRRRDDLVAELDWSQGKWHFANFHYLYDGKLTDLLTILKQLKAERDKDPSVKK